jgi:hypothetical protein
VRICLYAGPGAGKSKLAHFIADELGRDGFTLELASEVIKPRAYRLAWPSPWENFTNIMAPQLERERDWIESGVPHIVTDSPIFLQCFYMAARNAKPAIGCLHIARAWEEEHPAVNLYLERHAGGQYQQEGRYQDLKEAQRIDASLKAFLDAEGIECAHFDAFDRAEILKFVREALVEERPTPVRLAA